MPGRNQGVGRNGSHGGQGSHGRNDYRKGSSGKSFYKEKRFHPVVKDKRPDFNYADVKLEVQMKLSMESMDYADDMINSVRNETLVDLLSLRPVRTFSDNDDPDEEARENEVFEAQFESDEKLWRSRNRSFETNKRKLHGFIWKYCTQAMKDKLEREPDFNIEMFNDPILMLRRIKRFMTESDETTWEYFGLWETMKRLVQCEQRPGEDIASYRRRFEDCYVTLTEKMMGADALHAIG